MNADRLIACTEAIEQSIFELAALRDDAREELTAASKEAFRVGGTYGQADVSAAAGVDRFDEEILGVMVHAGLGELLERARAASNSPVSDFVARWQKRIDLDQLTTKRRA